jgi:hypothetical protein
MANRLIHGSHRNGVDWGQSEGRKRQTMLVLERLVVALFSLMAAGAVGALLLGATLRATRNFNEGWNAYHAMDAFLGRALYPAPDALVGNNYPPLSFLMTAAVMHFVPDAVFAGRLLASAAFVAVILLVGLIIHARDGDRLAACVGAAAFALYMAINSPFYPAMDDPQMLAHAIMLGGGYLLLRERAATRAVVAAALLMGVGLFVKHVLIALPMAAAIWLAVATRWKHVLWFTITLAVVGFLGLAACAVVYGPNFMIDLTAPRKLSLAKAWHDSLQALTPMKGLLVLSLLSVAAASRDRLSQFVGIYLVLALGVACLAISGAGVNDNIFYELIIACALASGHLVAVVRRLQAGATALRLWAVCAVVLAVLCDSGLTAAKDMMAWPGYLAAQRARAADTDTLVATIARQPGPALCQTPVFCYWAGKPFELDTYKFLQGVATGTLSSAALADRLAHREFGAVVLDRDANEPFPAPVMSALHENYVAAPEGYLRRDIYLPRPAAP